MEQNKTGKYFKYAIGEIILVVIGILIALSINNWNERRKDGAYEQKILIEIKTSLERDLNRTKFLIEGRVTPKEESINRLLNTVALNRIDYDTTLLLRDLRNMGLTLSFSYDKGPYESLKSIGLEKIRNDSLRSALVRFYEVEMPLRIIFVDINKTLNETERRDFFGDLVTYHLIKEIDTATSVSTVERTDLKTLQTHPSFIKYIILEERVALNYRRRLEHGVKQFERLITHINSVLKP